MKRVGSAAPRVEKPAGGARLRWWWAAALAFAASCATLVLELVAGRLLSPFVGSSLYTWTSIIGVVLAGISLGNWLGGRVADRRPSHRTIGLLLILGGLSALAALGFLALLGDGAAVRPIPLLPRIFALTTVAFFPPSFILAMVTPAIIRLALPDVRKTGRVVGLVFAVGTLGSLAGNFLTGFVLVAYLPVNTIVLGVAGLLLLLGALAGRWWQPAAAAPAPPVAEPVGAAGDGARPARRPLAAGFLSLPGRVGLACATVAVASFCSMVVELAASRILAPTVGVSLYTWTGIIGVVLAGIAAGNYAGGWIADRLGRQGVLGICLFLAGLAVLGVPLATQIASDPATFPAVFTFLGLGDYARLGLMGKIVALAVAVFLVPTLLLGTISPQVIKLVVADVVSSGRVAGRVYAWSTAGAIVGTFATGWLLIELLGVYTLTLVVGLALVALAIAVGRLWAGPLWRVIPSLVVAAGALGGVLYGLSEREALKSPCTAETSYFCIKVRDDTFAGVPVRALILDHLIHSYVKMGDPSFLGYSHEQVQAELTRYAAARTASPRVLVIGGGGYTYPRWVEAFVPAARVEVVEIDPGVTEIAYRELGLPRDTRIVTYNLDGRQFVHELAPRRSYQLVVQDAVNDLSVPYHILTREYNDYVRGILTEDGVYLLTVIDLYRDGQLLRSAVRTMMQTFPEVRLLGAAPQWEYPGASVFVIAGSLQRLDLEAMRQTLVAQGQLDMRTMAQPDDELRAYVAAGPPIVLTDQYAPVDNLIAILFSSRPQ